MKKLILSLAIITSLLNAGIIEDTYKESEKLTNVTSAKKIISRILNFETKKTNVHKIRKKAATKNEVKNIVCSLQNAAKYIAKILKKNGKKTLSELSYSNIFGKRYDDSEKGLFESYKESYKESDEIKTYKEIGIKIVLEAIQQELDFSPCKMYVMGGVENFVNKEKIKLGGYTQCVIFNLISKIKPVSDTRTPYGNDFKYARYYNMNEENYYGFLFNDSQIIVDANGRKLNGDDLEKFFKDYEEYEYQKKLNDYFFL